MVQLRVAVRNAPGQPCPHFLGRYVDIGSQFELDLDERGTPKTRRRDLSNASDGIETFFEDIRHILFNTFRRRIIEHRRHRQHREFHVRKLVYTETVIAEDSEHDERKNHHPGQDGRSMEISERVTRLLPA